MSMTAYCMGLTILKLRDLFQCGGFLLRNSTDSTVLDSIDHSTRNLTKSIILESEQHTKTLGLERNTKHDNFWLSPLESPPTVNLTNRKFVLDIAKMFDVLGRWFAPITINRSP